MQRSWSIVHGLRNLVLQLVVGVAKFENVPRYAIAREVMWNSNNNKRALAITSDFDAR
jgi:hypothetical protein